jgi:starch synthase
MRILLAASEAVPFCKTGGLADVVGVLGQKLGAAGHDVCLFLPKYRAVTASSLQGGLAQPLEIPLGAGKIQGMLRYMQHRKVSVYFVDCPPFFDRDGLYGADGKDHADNDARFAFFSRAVLEGAKAVGFKPDVVHVHDWQAGLVPAYLKRQYASDPFFAAAKSVFTIHNMAYQGVFPSEAAGKAGLAPADFEYYGKVSYLKAGLVFADKLTTVSPTYAEEIKGERGFGLEGVLRQRSADLSGILNGIDVEYWKPGLAKAEARRELERECGLSGEGLPLAGIVARLDRQKGLDLAVEAVRPRLDKMRLVILGDGDPAIRSALSKLAQDRPDRVHLRSAFDEAFARRVYAGSDLFLMPSRFEPCGLGQMIAMRYGSVPVVSRTGGLADTVSEPATGFVAEPDDAASLAAALDRALKAWGTQAWKKAAEGGMAADFSWERSIKRYLELFESLKR